MCTRGRVLCTCRRTNRHRATAVSVSARRPRLQCLPRSGMPCRQRQRGLCSTGRSAVYALYSRGPRTLPWGTPAQIPLWSERASQHFTANLRPSRKVSRNYKYGWGQTDQRLATLSVIKCVQNALNDSVILLWDTTATPEAKLVIGDQASFVHNWQCSA